MDEEETIYEIEMDEEDGDEDEYHSHLKGEMEERYHMDRKRHNDPEDEDDDLDFETNWDELEEGEEDHSDNLETEASSVPRSDERGAIVSCLLFLGSVALVGIGLLLAGTCVSIAGELRLNEEVASSMLCIGSL